jgi:hypothetical protein
MQKIRKINAGLDRAAIMLKPGAAAEKRLA